jgi:hypothetical protein
VGMDARSVGKNLQEADVQIEGGDCLKVRHFT